MERHFLDTNVYENLQLRLKFIFEEFDNIYVSFSGGKDSGLLLNLVLDYQQKYYPNKKIGVFHQDFEAQYNMTTEYVERTFDRIEKMVEPYWVCLPMATRTAVSNYEMYWYPWDDKKKDIWVRNMPKRDYVINLDSNIMSTYRYRMHQEDLAKQFGRWYRDIHGGTSTICLLGIRAEESLHRYNGFLNKKYSYKKQCWISSQYKNVWCGSPIYDWSLSDVWHAHFKFGYEYNKLYDLFFMSGLKPSQMRVASPFNDYAKDSLNLYRIIDPDAWIKLVGRVKGANFGSIYGKTKAMGYHNVTLPEGHTWKSFTVFLLSTLPSNVRNQYVKKFRTSIDFWHNIGGGLDDDVINELRDKGYDIEINGVSNYTLMKHSRVIFKGEIPDHTDDIYSTKDVPSWKRMCYCILKNDHICRFMGFGITRDQQRKIDLIREKYQHIEEINYEV